MFSATLRCEKLRRPWGTKNMPRAMRSTGARSSIGRPRKRSVPEKRLTVPKTLPGSVDFPAPVKPAMQATVQASRAKSKPRTMGSSS